MHPFLAVFVVVAVLMAPVVQSDEPETPDDHAPAVPSDWRIEPVALHGGSAPPPLDLDSKGRPHLMYCPSGEAWYAVRNDTSWERELLTHTSFGGVCGELALGPRDEPHVTTPVAAGVGLPLYGVKEAGAWLFDPTAVGSVQAVDSLGRPHSAYLVSTSADRVALIHVWRDGGWMQEEVEAFETTRRISARWIAFALDDGDQPHVLYYEDFRGDVRYAFRDAFGWHVEVVETIGALNIVGREGSLALEKDGAPHIAYTVRTASIRSEVRYGSRVGGTWTIEAVTGAAPGIAGGGFAPSLGLGLTGPLLTYRFADAGPTSSYCDDNVDLMLGSRVGATWMEETVVEGTIDCNDPSDFQDDDFFVQQFPIMVLDVCGNPHVAYYQAWWEGLTDIGSGTYYATKGTCDPEPEDDRTAALRLTPETLNLKSKGRWVTARLTLDNATVHELDPRSLELNGVPADKWKGAGRILVAKFDRQAVAATLSPGTEEVLLTGTWTDGTPFEATDTVRVIRPGKGPR